MTKEKELYKNLGQTEKTKEKVYTIMYSINSGRPKVFATGFTTQKEAQNRAEELRNKHSKAFTFGVREGKPSTIGFGLYSPIAFCK